MSVNEINSIVSKIRNGETRFAQSDMLEKYASNPDVLAELLRAGQVNLQQAAKYSDSALLNPDFSKDMIIAAAKANGYSALHDLKVLLGSNNEYLLDKEILMTAVHNNAKAMQFVPEDLKNDMDIIEANAEEGNKDFVPMDNQRIRQAINELRSNSVSADYYLRFDEFKTNKYFIQAVLESNSASLSQLFDECYNVLIPYGGVLDRDVAMSAVEGNAYQALADIKNLSNGNDPVLYDKAFLVVALNKSPKAIQFVPEELRNDPDLLAATTHVKLEEAKQTAVVEEQKQDNVEVLEALEKEEITIDEIEVERFANRWFFGRVVDSIKEKVMRVFEKATKDVGEKEPIGARIKNAIGKKVAAFESKMQDLREKSLRAQSEKEDNIEEIQTDETTMEG